MESGADYIGTLGDTLERPTATLLRQGDPSYGVWGLILPVTNVEALPSKQAGIDRPSTRSKQCQGGTKSCQEDVDPQILR